MKIDNDIGNLKGDRTYTRYDLIEIFCKEYKELNDATFRWMLYNMQLHKGLFRVKLVTTAKKLMSDVEMDIA